METFSIRELRERSGDLVRETERGHLALITKHGKPLCVTVPVTEEMMKIGVSIAIAVELFRAKTVSLGLAAKIAGVTYARFLDVLGQVGIPVVDYDPSELEREVALLG